MKMIFTCFLPFEDFYPCTLTNFKPVVWFVKYEIAECLEDPTKIHGETGEGLSFATGLIYQLATLQAVIKNIER